MTWRGGEGREEEGGGGKNFLQAMIWLILDVSKISMIWHGGRNGDHQVKPEECSNLCLGSLFEFPDFPPSFSDFSYF